MPSRQESLDESPKLREALIRHRITEQSRLQYERCQIRLKNLIDSLGEFEKHVFMVETGQFVDQRKGNTNRTNFLLKRKINEQGVGS